VWFASLTIFTISHFACPTFSSLLHLRYPSSFLLLSFLPLSPSVYPYTMAWLLRALLGELSLLGVFHELLYVVSSVRHQEALPLTLYARRHSSSASRAWHTFSLSIL
jgi:hypothetical protein